MKKRMFSIMFATILLLSAIPRVAEAAVITDFTDVKPGAWYYDAVDYAAKNGLYAGTSRTTFSPEAPMTRGMFVVVLGRFAGASESYKSTQELFSDIKESDYYFTFASWARDNGVISGVGNNQFAPNQPITREQIATMFFNYAKKFKYDVAFSDVKYTKFPDTGAVSSYAVDALKWTTWNEIINGTDGNISPKGIATRAQVAQMFFNFSKLDSPNETPSPSPPPTPSPNPSPSPSPTPSPPPWETYDPEYERPTGKSDVDEQGGYYDYDLANEIMDLIDGLRIENGAEPLKFHPDIQVWAGIRAKESSVSFSHTRPDGTSYTSVGYYLSGENLIASNTIEVDHLVTAWFNSEGHRMNLLNEVKKLGAVSCYIKNGRVYAAHLFSEKTIFIFDNAT